MSAPTDRRYLQTHEWRKHEGNTVTIGITQIAADELTDITFISLPKVGDKLDANGRFGEIESVKATSDLYTGVAGTVSAVNDTLNDNPGLVNQDPYDKGWMIKLKADNAADVQKLLDSADYLAKTGH
jgi:glycine cleavage system H protein